MKFLDNSVRPLGMGCWPIGGEMFARGQPVGYSNADDTESLRTISAALEAGIRVFDTAAGYGAGHSEHLLGKGLKAHPDAVIATKIGKPIDEDKRQFIDAGFGPADVIPAIDACRKRLDRDQIDIMLLHLNTLPVEEAAPVFDAMDRAVAAGKIASYGWSTDFTDNVRAMAERAHFKVIEHSMNVFVDVPKIQKAVQENNLVALIRSPLAMGLLSGKYDANTQIPDNDIRSRKMPWMPYYQDGRVNPELLETLNAVRELLMTDGRTLVQGAIGWLWGKDPNNVPVPGARTVVQIQGIAGALEKGPLPAAIMTEIEPPVLWE
ncbi:MAG: aldo/keto reductase, partial [Pseudomonadota bacterium]